MQEGFQSDAERFQSDFSHRFLVRKREQEGVIALERSALAARGFFLKDLLCFQGRDASDQHIEDVVLKMLQGEGRGGNNSCSQARASPSFRSLFKWPCWSVWSQGRPFQLCLQGAGDLTYIPALSGPLTSVQ